jgi:hypothetical protein
LNEMRRQSRAAPGDSDDEAALIVEDMGSLLSGATQLSIPIRPLHTSFRAVGLKHPICATEMFLIYQNVSSNLYPLIFHTRADSGWITFKKQVLT